MTIEIPAEKAKVVHLVLTPAEQQQLRLVAASAGKSMAAYVKEVVLERIWGASKPRG